MDRKLRQFLAVAETGNVSQAAETLNVSQPTVSVNLKRLEETYGVPLMTRSSRGVVLTEFGKVLYEHARGMERLSNHAAAEIRDLKDSARPKLRVACGFVWWELFMRRAIDDIRARAPEISVHVDICSSLEGIRGLLSGDVTFFVGTRVKRVSDGITLAFEKLFDTSDRFFAAKDHPLAGRPIRLDDLRAYPRLDVAPFGSSHLGIAERDHDRLKAVWDGFRTAQLSANSMTVGVSLLQDSDAWLYYTAEAGAHLEQHGIRALDVMQRPDIRTDIGIYSIPDAALSPLHLDTLDLIRDHAASSV